MTQCAIGIGSNIDAEKNIHDAARLLRESFPDISFSSVFRTRAREVKGQADFLNAVAICEADGSPQEMMKKLQEIEESLGKAPPYRFGPRTIDLDLLLFGNLMIPQQTTNLYGWKPRATGGERRAERVWRAVRFFCFFSCRADKKRREQTGQEQSVELILPHPRMHERRFVLEPLCELLDSQTRHPRLNQSWGDLLRETGNQRAERTDIVL
jgi:2-amino-4-hydroxy-6-hydroxymethyldihydropteridine diphosphokinase